MIECLYCSWREGGIESFGRPCLNDAEVRLLWSIIVISLISSLIILVPNRSMYTKTLAYDQLVCLWRASNLR